MNKKWEKIFDLKKVLKKKECHKSTVGSRQQKTTTWAKLIITT